MIENLDRSGWFGASDTKYIMKANHNTKTWKNWWDEKLGLIESDSSGNIYTRAGNIYEHPIIEAVDDGIIMHHDNERTEDCCVTKEPESI